MVRNLENSISNNSNIQDVGPRRSKRLNVALGEMAPLPRGSTMGTTAVTTRGEVYGTIAAVQASHSRTPRVEQPALAAKPAYAAQPAPAAKPAHAAKPAPAARPTPVVSQAARVGPKPSRPFGPTVEPRAVPQPFFADSTLINPNLVPGIDHPSTAQE